MPTYDYKCQSCGHTFEVFQKINDKHLESCPKCQKNNVKRLIGSGVGIIFKGPGFYATDYRKKSKHEAPATCPKSKEGCNACHHSH